VEDGSLSGKSLRRLFEDLVRGPVFRRIASQPELHLRFEGIGYVHLLAVGVDDALPAQRLFAETALISGRIALLQIFLQLVQVLDIEAAGPIACHDFTPGPDGVGFSPISSDGNVGNPDSAEN